MKKISFGSWAFAFGPYAGGPVPFDKVVARLGELGYDAVEICGRSPHVSVESCPSPETRGEVKKAISDAGLEISGFSADMAGIDPANESTREKYLGRFAQNLELASALGAPGVRVDSVGPPRKDAAALGRAAETFRAATEKAAERSIKVYWEFEPCFAFNAPSEIAKLTEAVAHPNFGVLFDTSHALLATANGDGGPNELLDQLSGKISAVHLADCDGSLINGTSSHFPLGAGRVDLPSLASKLGDLAVDYWTIDMCFWPGAWRLLAAQLAYAKRLAADVEPGAGGGG